MTTWKKPSGIEIELNDEPATVKKAKELGWEKKRGPKGNEKKAEDVNRH